MDDPRQAAAIMGTALYGGMTPAMRRAMEQQIQQAVTLYPYRFALGAGDPTAGFLEAYLTPGYFR